MAFKIAATLLRRFDFSIFILDEAANYKNTNIFYIPSICDKLRAMKQVQEKLQNVEKVSLSYHHYQCDTIQTPNTDKLC